jgi:succinate-acetate transporter protein
MPPAPFLRAGLLRPADGAGSIWAASLGQNAVATVFGIFAGFWLSYGMLLLRIMHNWFGIAPASVQAAKELYLVIWLVVIVTLTLTTLRLPLGRPLLR